MRYLLYSILVIVAVAAAAFTIIGVPGHLSRKPPLEVFPDMDRQAKLRPEKPFDFFTNGLSSQLPPAGTVVRSAPVQTADGAVYSYQDVPFNSGHVTGIACSPDGRRLVSAASSLRTTWKYKVSPRSTGPRFDPLRQRLP